MSSNETFFAGQQVFATVYDGDSFGDVAVRGLVVEVDGDGYYGVRMVDLRTGTVATFRVHGEKLARRSEPVRKVWTCTIDGQDIFTTI